MSFATVPNPIPARMKGLNRAEICDVNFQEFVRNWQGQPLPKPAPSEAILDGSAPVSYTHLDVYKRQGQMRMDKKPGSRIALGDGSKTVGYDVTYRYNGQQRTVRMDHAPGTQLPVIDGQVAVSYTHLDVYKRQALGGAASAQLHDGTKVLVPNNGTVLQVIFFAGLVGFAMVKLGEKVAGVRKLVGEASEVMIQVCLLYTSRCV